MTLREGPMHLKVRQLLECGSPLRLFPLAGQGNRISAWLRRAGVLTRLHFQY